MKILFATAQPFLPQLVGGVETSTIELGCALSALGHHVSVVSEIATGDICWIRNRLLSKLRFRKFPRARYRGIDVYRGWGVANGLAEVAAHVRPDAVVVQAAKPIAIDVAQASLALGFSTYFYMHSIDAIASEEIRHVAGKVKWIANSAFSHRLLQSELGVNAAIVFPFIALDAYRTNKGNTVTMINPRLSKGGDLAVSVAEQCPDIRFTFVEAWNTADSEMELIKRRAIGLSNVTWMPSQRDMRAVYGCTKLLLAPSRCAETWGRVVTEAQISGIPAIVSDMGALPETVGAGGVVVPSNAATDLWADAVTRLWADDALYLQYSKLAENRAKSQGLSAAALTKRFVEVVSS